MRRTEVAKRDSDESDTDAAKDIKRVMQTGQHPRHANKQRAQHEHATEPFFAQYEHTGHRHAEDGVIRGKTVIRPMGNQWQRVSDDEWTGIIDQQATHFCQYDSQHAGDHAHQQQMPALVRLTAHHHQQGNCEDEQIEILATKYDDRLHRV